jgi:phosphosulfolactate synthase
MDFLDLPERTSGSRTYGLTSIVDLGVPYGELKHILAEVGNLIDIAKIGIGTAYVTPHLKKKIELYQHYDIHPYCGGTLFEKCYAQNKVSEYAAHLKTLDIDWIEISAGTLDIPLEERVQLIKRLKQHFHVLAEVGSKDAGKNMDAAGWTEEMGQLLDAGCDYVITEGRDSATSGIYEKSGTIKSGLIDEMLQHIDSKKVIFEAPTPKTQMYFINEAGPNVNLGNVKPQDVLVLETQRLGLRYETFHMENNPACKLPL